MHGYIDPRRPHAINHLVVADLGDEEILLCACDDGDVIAYHTRAISAALERSAVEKEGPHDVKPFFLENVRQSAWGLAVHKEGRLIAVSSNTHRIVVFAFGLVAEDRGLDSDGPSKRQKVAVDSKDPMGYLPNPTRDAPKQSRALNTRIYLDGHRENIPCVAFFNGGRGDEGHWLVSTDIDGYLCVWDVWEKRCLTRYKFDDEVGIQDQPWDPYWIPDQRTRGWGTLCLDLRSFKVAAGNMELYGCDKPPVDPRTGLCDVSPCVTNVRVAAIRHPDFSSHTNTTEVVEELPPDMMAQPTDDLASEEDDLEGESDSDATLSGTMPVIIPIAPSTQQGQGGGAADPLSAQTQLMPIPAGILQGLIPELSIAILSENGGPYWATYLAADELSERRVPLEIPLNSGRTVKDGSARLPPDFAILHTTADNVRLMPGPQKDPSLICRQPLPQNLPPSAYSSVGAFKRLNMMASAPELGLVVIACQVGRAGLFTLTRSSREPRPQLAFRLDAILPFRTQERSHNRPNSPLLGIALGPVQGRERARELPHDHEDDSLSWRTRDQAWRRVDRRRRHRLLLTYYDGSVLSYEIGRNREDELAADLTGL
ncbi:MAG: hypothetical protein M1832_003055 [Thelocarpon impressellum]|nr:MAG: hypothetical protein M1832_003055 [Thelocarpon impressellum]